MKNEKTAIEKIQESVNFQTQENINKSKIHELHDVIDKLCREASAQLNQQQVQFQLQITELQNTVAKVA